MKKNNAMLWAAGRVRKRLPAVALMTGADIANALLSVAFALGTQRVIDTATAGEQTAFIWACAVQLAIILGILGTIALYNHLRDKLLAQLDRDWKKDLLHGLLHGEYAQVSQYHTGELLNRLNNDVRNFDTGLLTVVPKVLSTFVRLGSIVIVLAAMEPLFTLVAVLAGVAVIVATAVLRRSLKDLQKKVSKAEGKVSGFLQETLEKLLMVQALDVSEEIENRADAQMEARYQLQRRRKNVALMANLCVVVLSYGAGFAALVYCAGGLLHQTMTFGTLTAITQLVGQLQGPVVSLSGIIPQYIAMTAAAERLMELETLTRQEEPRQEIAAIYDQAKAICAENLTFGYDRDQVLENARFSLPKGEMAVVVGPSGTGKSTLLKLLMGIYRPQSGQLYIQTGQGSVPLDRSTRRLFAYVPQGNLLLSGTLRENLLITRPDATQEQIERAVYVSAMDEYLPTLPKGLDTVLGESAAGLSEGQAQRLSIARAVLSDAPILLLDEATSALDAQTERTVLERLQQLEGKTCIAVTHRPAAVELCRWQLEIQNGKCEAKVRQED